MREFTVSHNSSGDYKYNGKWKADFFKQLCMFPLRTIYSDYIQPLPLSGSCTIYSNAPVLRLSFSFRSFATVLPANTRRGRNESLL